jgi:hypothetical protein
MPPVDLAHKKPTNTRLSAPPGGTKKDELDLNEQLSINTVVYYTDRFY